MTVFESYKNLGGNGFERYIEHDEYDGGTFLLKGWCLTKKGEATKEETE